MGIIWPHETGNETNLTGTFMLRTKFASSRAVKVCALGLATLSIAVIFTTDSADARRRHKPRSHVARVASYNPAYSSIMVDGNSGAVLQATNPDALRHPASLTKIMTLYLLFERLESGKLSLDSEMDVSQHASIQAPTKLACAPARRCVSKTPSRVWSRALPMTPQW